MERWCQQRAVARGETIPLALGWQLACAWFNDRLTPNWRRRTIDEAQALFDQLGLKGSFWQLQ